MMHIEISQLIRIGSLPKNLDTLKGLCFMRIAILGAGAMGMLFGGHLSRKNEVTLIDIDQQKVDAVNQNGITICNPDGTRTNEHPHATTDSSGMPPADLIIVFVKAMFSRSALQANKALIGPATYVMTLQNGSGHEEVLREFAPPERIIIGTTQHNSSISDRSTINHGGGGKTVIGRLEGELEALRPISESFTACGIDTELSDQIRKMIWNKMFLNVSASVLTGVLQTKLGFLTDNEYAWSLTEQLLREAVRVANGDQLGFDEEEVVDRVKNQIIAAHDGYTSIYADLRDGRKTEVDTIHGSVVRASRRNGVPAPCHEFNVALVHTKEALNAAAAEKSAGAQ